MNGIGVGTSVGLGAIIGMGFVAPDSQLIEYVATFAFYGLLTGVIFELYRFAFSFRRPFGR
jgi:hypothetical protein